MTESAVWWALTVAALLPVMPRGLPMEVWDLTAVGGLVGLNRASIVASYATGAANGGAGDDRVGGLVGWNYGSIVASYATGAANGGGDNDNVGGLVGLNDSSATITASYGFGNATMGTVSTDGSPPMGVARCQ